MTDDIEKQIRSHTVGMERSLSGYGGGFPDLGRLVATLEAFVDSLEALTDARWVAQLRREWGQLEIVYALALDAGRSTLTDEEQQDIGLTIQNLRSLIPPP